MNIDSSVRTGIVVISNKGFKPLVLIELVTTISSKSDAKHTRLITALCQKISRTYRNQAKFPCSFCQIALNLEKKVVMNKSSKGINYGKWSVILGIPIALVGSLAAVVAVPDIGCRVGLNMPSCAIPLKEIELFTQTETGEFLAGVKIQFMAKGAPEVQYTDNNGYAKVQMPSRGDVRVNLSKAGYPIQEFTVNLENPQPPVRLIRFSQSGQPKVEQVTSLPPSTPAPSPSPNSSFEPSPTSSEVLGSSSVLTQTECQSATPGEAINSILRSVDNFSLTLGREVVPLLAYMGDYSGRISRSKPIEIVCNLQSSYSELKLVYGVHGGNFYSLPNNKLLFTVFLNSKPAGTKPVVVGPKQQWNLNVQGVTNVSLRAECTTETCPSLSFTEMTLK